MYELCIRLVGLPERFDVEAPPVRNPRGRKRALRVDSMRFERVVLAGARIS